MNKDKLIMQLIKTCSKYDMKNRDLNRIDGTEQENHLEDVVLYRALRMLTNKQIKKFVNSVKEKIN